MISFLILLAFIFFISLFVLAMILVRKYRVKLEKVKNSLEITDLSLFVRYHQSFLLYSVVFMLLISALIPIYILNHTGKRIFYDKNFILKNEELWNVVKETVLENNESEYELFYDSSPVRITSSEVDNFELEIIKDQIKSKFYKLNSWYKSYINNFLDYNLRHEKHEVKIYYAQYFKSLKYWKKYRKNKIKELIKIEEKNYENDIKQLIYELIVSVNKHFNYTPYIGFKNIEKPLTEEYERWYQNYINIWKKQVDIKNRQENSIEYIRKLNKEYSEMPEFYKNNKIKGKKELKKEIENIENHYSLKRDIMVKEQSILGSKGWVETEIKSNVYEFVNGNNLFTLYAKENLFEIIKKIDVSPFGFLFGLEDGILIGLKVFDKENKRFTFDSVYKKSNNGVQYFIGFLIGSIIFSFYIFWFVYVICARLFMIIKIIYIHLINEDLKYNYRMKLWNSKLNYINMRSEMNIEIVNNEISYADTKYKNKIKKFDNKTPEEVFNNYIEYEKKERLKYEKQKEEEDEKRKNSGFFKKLTYKVSDVVNYSGLKDDSEFEENLHKRLVSIKNYFNSRFELAREELYYQVLRYNSIKDKAFLYLLLLKEFERNIKVNEKGSARIKEKEIINTSLTKKDSNIIAEIAELDTGGYFRNFLADKNINEGNIKELGLFNVFLEYYGNKKKLSIKTSKYRIKDTNIKNKIIPEIKKDEVDIKKSIEWFIRRIQDIEIALKVFEKEYFVKSQEIFDGTIKKTRRYRKKVEKKGGEYYTKIELNIIRELKETARKLSDSCKMNK